MCAQDFRHSEQNQGVKVSFHNSYITTIKAEEVKLTETEFTPIEL